MNIAMMQPSFIPWQGYFELIYKSDIFVFLDDFQFSVQSYHQRNRLFLTKDKIGWYTVPVKKKVSFKSPLNKTVIDDSPYWRDKILKRLQNNYSAAEHYGEFYPQIERWLHSEFTSLGDMNIAFIKFICDIIGFKRDFRFSSDYPSEFERSSRVLQLLREFKATTYFSAQGSFVYMREDNVFPVKDIKLLFQNFKPSSYKQICSTDCFFPSLSVLDALFNIGPKKMRKYIESGTDKWLSWEDMVALNAVNYYKPSEK
ncbi:MAG: WbqC family protein [Candidatus Omnitrophica bacterium]|nr:WbqC family protein [Candidatus Omnitrophota bacterium]